MEGQHPYFYTLNDEDGLPSNEVYQVIQDDFGFIWIGCDAGLYRYDGFNFQSFQNSKQSSRSISNLKKDQNGTIWCQNFTGQLFHVASDSLALFHDASKESRHFPSYTIDSKNRVWIANDKNILILDKSGKTIKKLDAITLNLPECIFNDIEFSPNKMIYVGTNIKYQIEINPNNFNSKKQAIDKIFSLKNNFIELNNQLYQIKETNPERKYYLTEITSNGQGKEIPLPMKEGGFNYFISDFQEFWLLCNSDGIYVLDKEGKRIANYTVLFEGQKISNSFIDKEGNLWVTSLQDGIFIIPEFSIGVINTNNSILKDNNISSLHLNENGNIHFGTYSGLVYSYNPSNNFLELLADNTENKYRAVRCIQTIEEKEFVARGLFCIRQNGKEVNISELNNCRDFIIDGELIYYITNDRLGYYDLSLKKNFVLREKGGRKLALEKSNNTIFYGCDDGLFQFKNGEISELKNKNKSIFISDLYLDKNVVWMATHQHEIFKYLNGKIEIFELNLKENIGGIKTLLVKQDHLIYADENGLNIIHLKTNQKRNINFYDGLAYKEINDILLLEDKIYLATLKGLVLLPLNLSNENKIPPSIDILKVSAGSKVFDDWKNIEVDYGNQNLKIKFISTAFRSRGKFYYQYRVNNYSNQWIKLSSTTPEVTIPFLPSGDFIFEVVAVNEDGIISTESAKINIHVNAPYWEKWWFYTLLFLLSAGIVFIISIFRIRYLKQKARAKNKVLLSQLTALKAQMNPHFLFNTLNSIQALILEKDIKSANYYLSRFSTLTRKILAASDSNSISLEEEIAILELYLEMEKLRFGDDFKYEIKNKADSHLQIPSMIIQPYVENALKHGLLHKKGEKFLSIRFEKNANKLICQIEDNGVGREKAMEIKNRQKQQHVSFASQAIEKRIALLNESRSEKIILKIIDKKEVEVAMGTLITIEIPFNS